MNSARAETQQVDRCIMIQKMLSAFVVGGDAEVQSNMVVFFEELDWIPEAHSDISSALDLMARSPPGLVMLDLASTGHGALAVIREAAQIFATVPVLAIIAADHRPPAGFDGHVDRGWAPGAIKAVIAAWRPGDPLVGVRRLEPVFGATALAPLVAGLRQHLFDALGRMDEPDLAGRAHRLCGLAGTLGFDAVAASWRRLADGDVTAGAEAARTARLALAAIDRAGFRQEAAPGQPCA